MAGTVVSVFVALFVVRPWLLHLVARRLQPGHSKSHDGLPLVLGSSLWNQTALREALKQQFAPIVDALFLPVFFALMGLRTNVVSSTSRWNGASASAC
jgi:hypothetical protein